MMQQWIKADYVLDQAQMRSQQVLCIEGGVIVSVMPESDMTSVQSSFLSYVSGVVCPGFVDLQVNGAGGVLFNNRPSLEGIRHILSAHEDFGTMGVMPTVITDHPEVLEQAVLAAISAERSELEGFIGLHIEGPHLSHARRGTHAPQFIRTFDEHTMTLVEQLRAAKVTTMMTVAPEAITLSDISKLNEMGVTVSLGHSDAAAAEAEAALKAGASCFTHLYNAMSPMLSRAPGVTGVGILSDAYAGIICDGVHVDPMMVRLAYDARPATDRMFLVSDSMPTLGGPEQFELYGQPIRLRDGRLVNREGALAGAHISQAQGVMNLVSLAKLSVHQALDMAISVPAQLVGALSYASVVGQALDRVIVVDHQTAAYQGSLAAVLHQ